MTLDVDGGKGQIERPGTVRRMFIAGQRSNRVVIRVSVCVCQPSQNVFFSPELDCVVDNLEATWDSRWACEVH